MQILTRKDYDFYECSSAFQKSIRRGYEKDAIFFGWELYASGYSKYCWKRLFVIVSEDIGLANNDATLMINTLFQNWETIAAKNIEEASLPFIHAIMYLCRSQKSRIIDEYKIWILKTDYQPPIPDYALDVHTRRGKRMGRDHNFFLEEGQKINNEVDPGTDHSVKDFYAQYLKDYAEKKCPETGYNDKNVTHKSPRDMEQFKREYNQTKLF